MSEMMMLFSSNSVMIVVRWVRLLNIRLLRWLGVCIWEVLEELESVVMREIG